MMNNSNVFIVFLKTWDENLHSKYTNVVRKKLDLTDIILAKL